MTGEKILAALFLYIWFFISGAVCAALGAAWIAGWIPLWAVIGGIFLVPFSVDIIVFRIGLDVLEEVF